MEDSCGFCCFCIDRMVKISEPVYVVGAMGLILLDAFVFFTVVVQEVRPDPQHVYTQGSIYFETNGVLSYRGCCSWPFLTKCKCNCRSYTQAGLALLRHM